MQLFGSSLRWSLGASADQHRGNSMLLEPHSFKAAHEEFSWIRIDLNLPGERKQEKIKIKGLVLFERGGV